MVSKHLVRLVLLLWSCWLAQAVLASGLTITPEQERVELGKPIWLTLRSDQTRVSLDTLDLSPWQDKVVLPRSYSANPVDNQKSQIMKLKVYPFHEGTLTLPGLHFLYQTTRALNINVIPALDGKQHLPIDFQCHVSTHQPWQQQQVIVACRISMANAYAVFTQPGMERRDDVQVFDMQVRQHTSKEHNVKRTGYELGWVVTPLRAGKLQLQLPPIQYVHDGVVTRQFYLPTQHFEVRVRPAWLPGTIPVGRVRVSHYGISGMILNTDVLNHVRLDMQLDGMPVASIPSYALQLHSNQSLHFYASQRKLDSTIGSDGIHHQLTEDIPMVAKQVGFYQLPDIRLQYFDPHSGLLKTSLIPGSTILILNYWLSAILLLCLAVFSYWLARRLWRYLLRIWRRYRIYQFAAGQLRQAQSLADIKQAMRTIAQAEGWPTNLTYLQWQRRMQAVTPLVCDLDVLGLNAANYDRAEFSTKTVVECLLRIIRHRQWRTS